MMTDENKIQIDPQRARTQLKDDSRPKRRTGRLITEHLTSSLGRVIDIAAGGVRIAGRRLPLDLIMAFTLTLNGEVLAIKGKVVRVRRIGLFRHEVGIEFHDVTEQQRKVLTRFCMNDRSSQLMCRDL